MPCDSIIKAKIIWFTQNVLIGALIAIGAFYILTLGTPQMFPTLRPDIGMWVAFFVSAVIAVAVLFDGKKFVFALACASGASATLIQYIYTVNYSWIIGSGIFLVVYLYSVHLVCVDRGIKQGAILLILSVITIAAQIWGYFQF